MKLTIDLSSLEESNIRGWVNKGLAEPDFANHPYRLVLEERTRARFDQIAAQFAAPPVPPPTDPLARIKAAPSQWAKWFDLSSAEAEALIAGGHLTRDQKNLGNNWWGLNGVKGRRDGSRYVYFTYPGGVETTNVDQTTSAPGDPVRGRADAATEQTCGLPIPGPALP